MNQATMEKVKAKFHPIRVGVNPTRPVRAGSVLSPEQRMAKRFQDMVRGGLLRDAPTLPEKVRKLIRTAEVLPIVPRGAMPAVAVSEQEKEKDKEKIPPVVTDGRIIPSNAREKTP